MMRRDNFSSFLIDFKDHMEDNRCEKIDKKQSLVEFIFFNCG